MTAEDTQKIVTFRDLFAGDFWRYFVRAVWLFFPAIIFLLLAYLSFWHIVQGQDLVVITLENSQVFFLVIIALTFWVYVTWYSSRLVAKAKLFQENEKHPMWLVLLVHVPRMLGFTCITLIILAFFRLPYPQTPKLSSIACHLLLLFSFSWYFIIYVILNRVTRRSKLDPEDRLNFLNRIRIYVYTALLGAAIIISIYTRVWGMIIFLMVMQVLMVLLLIIRRKIIETRRAIAVKKGELDQVDATAKSGTWKKIRELVTDTDEKLYFRGFNIISSIAVVVYLLTIISVEFSTRIGSFPFAMIAFGVLLGLGNFVAMISVLARFNFHLLFIVAAFFLGYIKEPHNTRLVNKFDKTLRFNKRQHLKEYFDAWLQHPDRKMILDDSTAGKYPVYFVLTNGGASRSGYWAASVLSILEDQTEGRFSKHLFCLSGTSGGSLGNAAFFTMLGHKEELFKNHNPDSAFLKTSTSYVKADFLTFTLSRMLGPDVFRHLLPLYPVSDRAAALAIALEKAPGKKNFLYDKLSIGFSSVMTQKNKPYDLPIICINATRMQDGSPAVISNIKITEPYFSKRVDILSLVNEEQDLKFSTAVVVGASFPYVSPAGRINHKPCDTCRRQPHYFVDGAYFDNSGAGVVYEILFNLNEMMEDDAYKKYRNKLDFYILHITNDEIQELELRPVNPLANDLAAPVKTLLGAYGTQTSVNDYRLKKYINSLYNDSTHYKDINLYTDSTTINFSMNWVISEYQLNAMDKRLQDHEQLKQLVQDMKYRLR